MKPLPEAVRAIQSADLILVGPGSLYTSIIPNLLVEDIGKAIVEAKGRKIYICNLMTQKGETIKYSASDHVQALYDHVSKPFLDSILVNNFELPLPIKANYKEENAEPVIVDIERLERLGLEVIKKNIATVHSGVVRHESAHIAKWLKEYALKFFG